MNIIFNDDILIAIICLMIGIFGCISIAIIDNPPRVFIVTIIAFIIAINRFIRGIKYGKET